MPLRLSKDGLAIKIFKKIKGLDSKIRNKIIIPKKKWWYCSVFIAQYCSLWYCLTFPYSRLGVKHRCKALVARKKMLHNTVDCGIGLQNTLQYRYRKESGIITLFLNFETGP